MTPSRLIATGFGAGLLPAAPGTWGSLAALPPAWALHWAGGFPALALATLAAVALGFWAVGRELAGRPEEDPGEIVIDEIAGQWLALWPLSFGLWYAERDPALFPWPGWVGAFLLFRLLDILKPPPVRQADALPGALGVMLDDLVAGAMAAALLLLAAALAHGWLA
jgi:phosphatidylglycerophosphatase A